MHPLGSTRRGEDGDNNVNPYQGFPHVIKEKGMELRAAQVAHEFLIYLYAKNPESIGIALAKIKNESTNHSMIAAREAINFKDNNWQNFELDKNSSVRKANDGSRKGRLFQSKMIQNLQRLLLRYENHSLGALKQTLEREISPGMPKSVEEAAAANDMTDEIERFFAEQEGSLLDSDRDLRKLERKKARNMRRIKLLSKRETDKRPENPKVMKGPFRTLLRLIRYDFDAVLEQMRREADLKDIGEIKKETLDNLLIKWIVEGMATDFIAGETPEEVFENPAIRDNFDDIEHYDFSFAPEFEGTGDRKVGEVNFEKIKEHMVKIAELQRALDMKNERIKDPARIRSDAYSHTVPMSIKLSCLAPVKFEGEFDDLTEPPEITPERKETIKSMLRELLDLAIQNNVFIRLDQENFFYKDLFFQIFTELLTEDPAKTAVRAKHMGVVLQTYQEESREDAEKLIELAKHIKEHFKVKLNIRPVKGAYVNKEAKYAKRGLHKNLNERWFDGKTRKDWHVNHTISPILPSKEATQANFTKIMRLLEENTDCLDTAYALHNTYHISQIFQTWLNHGEMPKERQLQVLLGMMEVRKRVISQFTNIRNYAPFERYGKISLYLKRRFIEFLEQSEDGFYEARFDEEWAYEGEVRVQKPNEA